MTDDDAFDEKTAVTGGLRSMEDYRTCLRLLQEGKEDEALFQFRVTKARLHEEMATWAAKAAQEQA